MWSLELNSLTQVSISFLLFFNLHFTLLLYLLVKKIKICYFGFDKREESNSGHSSRRSLGERIWSAAFHFISAHTEREILTPRKKKKKKKTCFLEDAVNEGSRRGHEETRGERERESLLHARSLSLWSSLLWSLAPVRLTGNQEEQLPGSESDPLLSTVHHKNTISQFIVKAAGANQCSLSII